MEKTISTTRLLLVATEERKYAPDELLEDCQEIVEYEIFLKESSISEEIGYVIVCVVKEQHSDNICLFHYIIKEDLRRKGYCYEAVSAILDSIPKGFTVFADVRQSFLFTSEEDNASVGLLKKCGFNFIGMSSPGIAQYEKKL